MMIISFAWTTEPLLAGRKTRTRRDWALNHSKKFKVGDLVQAYDKLPIHGGRRVAIIKITGIKHEHISEMPDEDYEKEGFAYMEEQGLTIWGKKIREAFEEWRKDDDYYWVIDFELVEKVI